jgi:hypothetical protein
LLIFKGLFNLTYIYKPYREASLLHKDMVNYVAAYIRKQVITLIVRYAGGGEAFVYGACRNMPRCSNALDSYGQV